MNFICVQRSGNLYTIKKGKTVNFESVYMNRKNVLAEFVLNEIDHNVNILWLVFIVA